ncbi:MAG: type III pantothenate kinase [Bacteroidales bacterium]|nr:type III pantothenate kinase [Bacteroidales bacterium]
MNLTIDIGNTRSKIAVFKKHEIIEVIAEDELSQSVLQNVLLKYAEIKSAIVSTVKNIDPKIISFLKSKLDYFIELNEDTDIPIENLYKTKGTLGKDRLATIIGANNIFPGTSVLVIDMGTAITFDFINNKNQYSGGTISPGMEMRFKALNQYTGKLPLLTKNEEYRIIADNTENAIISGVQNGIIFETDSYINTLKSKYEDLKIFLTGGDAIFFDKKLKNTIFVNLNLNFTGLNRILEYNIRK